LIFCNSSLKKQKDHHQQKKDGIERFFVLFSKKREAIYKAERMGKRTDLYLTLISALNGSNIK